VTWAEVIRKLKAAGFAEVRVAVDTTKDAGTVGQSHLARGWCL